MHGAEGARRSAGGWVPGGVALGHANARLSTLSGVAGEPRLRKGSMPQAEPPPFHAYQGPNSELLPSCFPGKAFI